MSVILIIKWPAEYIAEMIQTSLNFHNGYCPYFRLQISRYSSAGKETVQEKTVNMPLIEQVWGR